VAANGLLVGPDPAQVTAFPAYRLGVRPAAMQHLTTLFAGGGAASTLALTNPTAGARATGSLHFYDDAGQPTAIAVNGESAATSVRFDVAPLGSAFFTIAAPGPLRVVAARAVSTEGSVELLATRAAAGASGGFVSEPAEPLDKFIAGVRRDTAASVNTQVSLFSAATSNVTLVLRDARGTAVAGGTAQVRIPANGAVRRTLNEWFPSVDTGSFQGTITATVSEGAVAAEAVELRGAAGARSAMPVAPLLP
jgi:hypothetical protein